MPNVTTLNNITCVQFFATCTQPSKSNDGWTLPKNDNEQLSTYAKKY